MGDRRWRGDPRGVPRPTARSGANGALGGGTMRRRPLRDGGRPRAGRRPLGFEALDGRVLPATLTAGEVGLLLDRAAAASASNDGIIAVVDRNGSVLGVRVESGVSPLVAGNLASLTFAVDGALAEARSAAFFSTDAAPITSRTVEFLSQSTITQREVESSPNVPDPNSPFRGPGFVAPIGVKGHFPPGVMFKPSADFFEVEHTNRDSILHPGLDGIKGTGDDLLLPSEFNVNPGFIPPGQATVAPESYGLASGFLPTAQSRGLGTLPGGVPLYKVGSLVGAIGV